MTPIKPYKDGSVLYVLATPQAAKDRLGEVVEDADGQPYLKVYVTAVPEKGKANKAILTLLAKKLDLSKSQLELIYGEKDRRKQIAVAIQPQELESRLKFATGSLF
jgi:uncharacterized protein (TIGR00251 family)